MIQVLVVDDHNLVREGVMALLRLHDGIEVVGEASNGIEAIEKAEDLKPDVILMDIAMPGLGGLEATIEIKKRHPDIRILVLSQYDDREYVGRFLRAGASGYILKKAMGSELVRAVRVIARGEAYLYPSVATTVIGELLGSRGQAETDPYDLLTDREKQVLKLIAEGLTHKEIAQALGISAKTVIAHQTHISEKLDIRSKADLIKFAIAKGVIRLDQ